MYLKRIVRCISLSFFLILFGAFLGYLFRRTLAIELSVSDYGLFFSMITFFSFFMLFIDLGLEQAATKYIVEFRLKNKLNSIHSLVLSVLSFQLFLSFLFFLIFFIFADFLAINYFHSPSAGLYLKLLSFWFLTTPFVTFIAYILLGFQRTTWYTALDFFRMLFLLIFTLIYFNFQKELLGAVLGYMLLNLILFIIYLPYILSFFSGLFQGIFSFIKIFDWLLLKQVFFYGIIIAFTNFGWIIINQTDTMTLTYFTSPYEVGLYTVALPISLLLLFFMRPVNIVFSPFVTELATEKKYKKLSEAIHIAYQYIFILLLPFALCLVAFPEYIIPILFDFKYLAAAPALMILAIGTLFYAFSVFNNIVFTGLGKAKIMACSVACVALMNLVLNIILIPIFGIVGVAFSTMLSYILLFAISTFYLFRILHFSFPFSSWLKALVCSFLTLLIVFFVKNILQWNNIFEAVFCGTLLILFYIIFLYIFRVINFQEILQIVEKLEFFKFF